MACKIDIAGGDVPHCLATSGNDSKRATNLISIKDKNKVKMVNPRSSNWACSTAVGATKKCTRRPTVQVCPINVGQGDSILLKLQYEQGNTYMHTRNKKNLLLLRLVAVSDLSFKRTTMP